jgi:DNA-binding transcriptional regulator LsrR (DeoR family)
MISKEQYEAQLQQIFRLLLENKSQEEIARELNISTRSVAREYQRIENRYGEIQRQKTYDTIFLEAQLFKNRLLHLYKILAKKAQDPKVNGNECAKFCEVAANVAEEVLKMESEGIKAVKQGRGLMAAAAAAAAAAKTARTLSTSTVSDSDMIEELEKSC